jgi:hypothetical protein
LTNLNQLEDLWYIVVTSSPTNQQKRISYAHHFRN